MVAGVEEAAGWGYLMSLLVAVSEHQLVVHRDDLPLMLRDFTLFKSRTASRQSTDRLWSAV